MVDVRSGSFPAAAVVASDVSSDELARAAKRIHAQGLSSRVSTEPIDLASVHAFARAESEGDAELPAVDVITCALGLFFLPPSALAPCLRGLRALLRPGGLLVAAVWEDMALLPLGSKCVSVATGGAAPPLPFSPESLGGGRADALLAAAGLASEGLAWHNHVAALPLRLGPHRSDEAFMLGLMPFAPALAALTDGAQVPPGAFARCHAAFDEEVARANWVSQARGGEQDEQDVVVPLRWRLLAARRLSPGMTL